MSGSTLLKRAVKVANKGILYVSYKKIKKNCKGYQV